MPFLPKPAFFRGPLCRRLFFLTELTIFYTIVLLPTRRIYLYSLLSLRDRQVHRGLFLEN
jgi:hypothetical protein